MSLAIILLVIGLYNSELQLNEKGFYGLAFTQSLFAIIVIQKNSRDIQRITDISEHFAGRSTIIQE